MRVMITGGSGYVGSFVEEELRNLHDVVVIDLKPPEEKESEFIKCDILRRNQIMRAMKNIDAVIHLAGGLIEGGSYAVVELNAMGTLNVLEAAVQNGVAKVLHASSDSALGFTFSKKPFSPDYFPVDEGHSAKPQDAYGVAKLLAEELCRCYFRGYGVRTVCLRHCWVWSRPTYARYQDIMKQEHLNVKRLWGYVDVRDVAQAYRLALESKDIEHEVFFIAAENTFTKTASIELIRTYYPTVRTISDDYLKEKNKSLFDTSKAKKLLGFRPEFNYEDLVESPQEATAKSSS